MTSPSFTTAIKLVAICLLALVQSAFAAAAPRIAFLTPDGSSQSKEFVEELVTGLSGRVTVVDSDLAEAAYHANPPASPFNVTAEESKRLGHSIGCDFMVVTRAVIQRRSASGRSEYYEAYAPIYIVSSRTGRLVYWELQKYEANKQNEAAKLLMSAASVAASSITTRVEKAIASEYNESTPPYLEEPPEPESTLAKDFKAPIPFRRIKPEYTDVAAAYDIAATVEITVDLDASGKILRTDIVRWAGFGLDESVEHAVRQMNWRPAERNGRFIPMRFLLRYNFKKVPKE